MLITSVYQAIYVVYQDMKENLITTGSNNEILEHLNKAEYGTHSILISPDIQTLRETYSRYVKRQLEDSNESVLNPPYYETADKVRKTLSIVTLLIEARPLILTVIIVMVAVLLM